ncbi:Protein of unknown function [Auraticoccus monumenti]|uniref:DUF3071 domain-containing protein n=2 Tax=Auraticoccus monumenti TaxID=675864 RepID=A0A1G7CHF6_9ACTN|nr:Protein of unknown function [Auraticoccus monumenti]
MTPDGGALVVVTESGEELAVAVDDRLRAVLRRDRPGLAQVEMLMESELRPREIQDRIRGGASAEQVAEEAGVDLARIQAFAAPVLAERTHVAALALASSVRRRGEPLVGRSLREVVTEQLVKHGRSTQDLQWDAWREEDRQWRLSATLTEAGEDAPARRGLFRFDLKARFTTADNDDARWLLAELTTARRTSTPDPDGEPTEDLEDSLALVRALSQGRPLSEPGFLTEVDEAREDSGPIWRPGAPRHDSGRLPRLAPPVSPRPAASGPTPGTPAAPSPAAPSPAAPSPAAPAEDDPYDIIPDDQSDLDVLYEMLGGLHEDSVTIYPGLSDPPVDEPAPAEPTSRAERRRLRRRRPDAEDQGAGEGSDAPGPEGATPADQPVTDGGSDERTEPLEDQRPPDVAATTTVQDAPSGEAGQGGDDIEQPSLLDDGTEPRSPEPPARKPGRRKRASVPSWDEIVFGSPKR